LSSTWVTHAEAGEAVVGALLGCAAGWPPTGLAAPVAGGAAAPAGESALAGRAGLVDCGALDDAPPPVQPAITPQAAAIAHAAAYARHRLPARCTPRL
jgi:hypothetical protein